MCTKKFHYVSVLVLFAGWYMSSDDSKISTDAIGDVNEYLLSPTKGGALKVTIPDDLNDDLSAYAAGYNTSKSEVVRNSVASFMGNDLRWTHRQYFFRPRRKLVSFEDLRMCTGFVQVACFPKDLPRNASGVTVKLLKYEKNFSIITFDLGNGVVPHPPYPIQGGDIDLGPGSLVMPTVEQSTNIYTMNIIYYRINNDLIWGVCPAISN